MKWIAKETAMKLIIFAAVLAIMAIMSPTTRAADFDYEGQVGLAYLDQSRMPALEIPVGPDGQLPLKPGTPIAVVIFTHSGQQLVRARVKSGPLRLAVTEAKVTSPSDSYTLAGFDSEVLTGVIGVGVANADGQCRLSGGAVRCDLEADSPAQSFRVCASREALHFSIWTGEPLEGEQRWRVYYYLGYDLEPDCTEQDFPE